MLNIKRIIHIIKMLKRALNVSTTKEVEKKLMEFYGEMGIFELEKEKNIKYDIKDIYERLTEIQFSLKHSVAKRKIRRKVKEILEMLKKIDNLESDDYENY